MSDYITVEFTTPRADGKVVPVTDKVRDAFNYAAKKWSEAVSATKPAIMLAGGLDSVCKIGLAGDLQFNDRIVSNLLIVAEIIQLDGPDKTLGRASICTLETTKTNLPAVGYIQLDAADVDKMIQQNALERLRRVIMHEMGHCLGIGVLWNPRFNNLLQVSTDGKDVVYKGVNGVSQYNALRSGKTAESSVPVESGGGQGTSGSHWRNSVFGNELMTGFIGGASQPLSVLTLGALQDLGYDVDLTKAEAYAIPNSSEIDENADKFGDDVPPGSEDNINRVPGIFPNQPVNNLLAQIAIGFLLTMIVLVGAATLYRKVQNRRKRPSGRGGVELRNVNSDGQQPPAAFPTGNPFRDPNARSRTASDLAKDFSKGANPFAQEEQEQLAPV